jgi:hypothetical protein
MSLLYYELPKLPDTAEAKDTLTLWLKLFKAETEEDLQRIERLGGALMGQTMEAYRAITAESEFREAERLRSRARHNEASAISHAVNQAVGQNNEKWQTAVADIMTEKGIPEKKKKKLEELITKNGME